MSKAELRPLPGITDWLGALLPTRGSHLCRKRRHPPGRESGARVSADPWAAPVPPAPLPPDALVAPPCSPRPRPLLLRLSRRTGRPDRCCRRAGVANGPLACVQGAMASGNHETEREGSDNRRASTLAYSSSCPRGGEPFPKFVSLKDVADANGSLGVPGWQTVSSSRCRS